MASQQQKFKPRALTAKLKELALEAETVLSDGTVITKLDRLAELIWEQAIGAKLFDPKTKTETITKPQAWAQQLLYERLEGRVPQAPPEDQHRISVAERVSDLARQKLNRTARVAVAVSQIPRSVDRSDNGPTGSEEPAG